MNNQVKQKIIQLRFSGKTYNEIKNEVGCSKGTISYHCGNGQKEKTRRRIAKSKNRKREFGKWRDELLNQVVSLHEQGKNCKEISLIINNKKTSSAICRKLNRMGYKGKSTIAAYKNGKYAKYMAINWVEIQNKYNEGIGYVGIIKIFKITTHAIEWAKKNNLLKLRTVKDGIRLARLLGKYPKGNKEGIERYRQMCEFKFNVYDYPHEYNFKLIEKYGWYKAKNNGNNLDGVSRDHKYSVSEGFIHNISPYLLSHPANCELILHRENSSKKDKCSITLKELKKLVEIWENKYGQMSEFGLRRQSAKLLGKPVVSSNLTLTS